MPTINIIVRERPIFSVFMPRQRTAGENMFEPERLKTSGWPLLTVEIETNGESKSTYERGPSLVGSLGS